jgi:uncharacterized membrane protein YfcA
MMLLATLGLLIGAVMGLTGAGGGILAVPALMLALDQPLADVAPVALLAVAVSAAIGAWGGLRDRLVRYRAAMLMSIAGIPFTALGVRLGALLEARQRIWLFVALMLYVGVRQLRSLAAEQLPLTREGSWRPLDACTGRIAWSWTSAMTVAAIGACTGLATGLLGVGGGFIIVPLLQRFSNVSIQGIIATALMVIALVSGGGVLIAVAHGARLPLSVALPFVGSATVGMFAGRQMAKLLSPRLLQSGFSALVFAVALAMTFENLYAG